MWSSCRGALGIEQVHGMIIFLVLRSLFLSSDSIQYCHHYIKSGAKDHIVGNILQSVSWSELNFNSTSFIFVYD